MTVYVDDMKAKYGRMIMCHMVADTEEELHAMADLIGVDRKWYQYPHKSRYPHYDIALSKREIAVAAGALEIRWRDSPAICRRCIEAIIMATRALEPDATIISETKAQRARKVFQKMLDNEYINCPEVVE